MVRSAVEVILPAGFSTGEAETERLEDLTRLKGKLVFWQNGQVGILNEAGTESLEDLTRLKGKLVFHQNPPGGVTQ